MHTKFINSAASNNAQTILNNGAALWSISAFNAGGAAAYVKLYNKASLPTVGTDTPVFVLAVPAAGNAYMPDVRESWKFPLGLQLAIVTGAADTDNTAVAANQVKVALAFGN